MVDKNKKKLLKLKNIRSISETYYPRFYLYWLEDILSKEIKLKKTLNSFINGKVKSIQKKIITSTYQSKKEKFTKKQLYQKKQI